MNPIQNSEKLQFPTGIEKILNNIFKKTCRDMSAQSEEIMEGIIIHFHNKN